MSVRLGLAEAAEALAGVSDTPRLDAELLMADLLGVTRGEMLLHWLDRPVPSGIANLVVRRMGHEPVAYILGRQEFYGLELELSADVLIPRGDSEVLIEAARRAFASRAAPARILDLGTGSGALLLAALSLWPAAEGVGIDRSAAALAVAQANAARHAPAARMIEGDWDRPGWSDDLGRFDLVLANPPYVEDDAPLAPGVRDHEPHGALFAGREGLDAYRVLLPQLPALLAPQGVALVEIGASQAASVAAIAAGAMLAACVHRDLGGRDRALELRSVQSR